MYYILYYILIILLFYITQNIKNRKRGLLLDITTGGGLGNKIAGIPGAYLLSLLSNRIFHSIVIYNFNSKRRLC